MDLIHPDLSEKVLEKQKAQRAEQETGKWWKELIERKTWFTQGIISWRQVVELENNKRFRDTDLYCGVVCQKACEPIEESTSD